MLKINLLDERCFFVDKTIKHAHIKNKTVCLLTINQDTNNCFAKKKAFRKKKTREKHKKVIF